MQRPVIPFGVWIAGLTLMGGGTLFVLFVLAFGIGGPYVFIVVAVAALAAPCSLVYMATKSWPQQPLHFCFSYSAFPVLGGAASVVSFSPTEWQQMLFWTSAGVITVGMTLLGAFLGRRAAQRQPEWRIKHGLCPACGYPVGISDLCTECGKPVRPEKVEPAVHAELEKAFNEVERLVKRRVNPANAAEFVDHHMGMTVRIGIDDFLAEVRSSPLPKGEWAICIEVVPASSGRVWTQARGQYYRMSRDGEWSHDGDLAF